MAEIAGDIDRGVTAVDISGNGDLILTGFTSGVSKLFNFNLNNLILKYNWIDNLTYQDSLDYNLFSIDRLFFSENK